MSRVFKDWVLYFKRGGRTRSNPRPWRHASQCGVSSIGNVIYQDNALRKWTESGESMAESAVHQARRVSCVCKDVCIAGCARQRYEQGSTE